MARKTLNQCKTDMLTLMPDNTSGLISPADVRSVFTDLLDSLNPAAAMAYGSPQLATSLTATPTRLPASYFTSNYSDDPIVLEGRSSTFGDIIAHSAVGQLNVSIDVTFFAGNGVDVNFYIGRNGTVLPALARATGTGSGDYQTVNISWLVVDLALNDTFTAFAATPAGAASVTIGGCSVKGILLPTVS